MTPVSTLSTTEIARTFTCALFSAAASFANCPGLFSNTTVN
jgi:hypothetical protein